MSHRLPAVYVVRHGETAWSLAGRHTGRSDIPLTGRGEENARLVGRRLDNITFAQVFTSPSSRARRTCELAGFGEVARVEPDLAEWDYGDFEGFTLTQIRSRRPDWQLFRDGPEAGESLTQIGARADRIVERLRAVDAEVLLFSSGHISRVLAARWLGLAASDGRLLALGTASLSVLGYEHARDNPVILLWNDRSHLDQE